MLNKHSEYIPVKRKAKIIVNETTTNDALEELKLEILCIIANI